MKNMPVDNKVRLIQTHKMRATRETRADTTPLSEHLKILDRAGTQSLPLVRLEKLRVDISYQSIQQTNAFIEGGGLRLLLIHLGQLNARRTATRRIDELNKENEILRCILGLAKVPAGAAYLVDGTTSHLRHVMDSAGSLWLPCAVVALRIGSYLVQQESLHCVASVLSSMFRRDTATSEASSAKRNPPFVEWMEAIDQAVKEYVGRAGSSASSSPPPGIVPQQHSVVSSGQQGNRAIVVDFISSSLMFVNSIVDALSSNIDRRIKFYDRINAHDMFVTFALLRQWNVSVITSHLNRWEESLRRDYNLSRSQRSDTIVLDNGTDSSIRDFTLFKSFAAQYEAARAEIARSRDSALAGAQSDNAAALDVSDNEDEYLRMDLSTYASGPSDSHASIGGAKRLPAVAAHETVSAPVTPRHLHSHSHGAATTTAASALGSSAGGNLTPNNPFYTTRDAVLPADLAKQEITRTIPPFVMHLRSHSGNVAETGSLRDLRPATTASAVASNTTGNKDTVIESGVRSSFNLDALTAAIGSAHELLRSASADIPTTVGAAVPGDHTAGGSIANARRNLLAVVDLAQSMLCALEQKN
ncbi:hypothetical protein H4217_007819 [Coemansia sp. RSA 1939]|nr:hypothetical protein H4217_007819 [Coemansia sp. RSA 1939]KAJ2596306.1 hypothetical protein EV177_007962 [Coemansia sp. RSA 1804]KAJ2664141.1 hypothetical protein GGH99_006864 [Coemansia sp. RSA 1285]